MSMHHRDFIEAAVTLNRADAAFEQNGLKLRRRLNGLVEELENVAYLARDMNSRSAADDREQQIRDLRVEFGFLPDDEPTAHLRPLAV